MSEIFLVLMPVWIIPAVLTSAVLVASAVELGPHVAAASIAWARERWRTRSRPGYGWPRPAAPEEKP